MEETRCGKRRSIAHGGRLGSGTERGKREQVCPTLVAKGGRQGSAHGCKICTEFGAEGVPPSPYGDVCFQ